MPTGNVNAAPFTVSAADGALTYLITFEISSTLTAASLNLATRVRHWPTRIHSVYYVDWAKAVGAIGVELIIKNTQQGFLFTLLCSSISDYLCPPAASNRPAFCRLNLQKEGASPQSKGQKASTSSVNVIDRVEVDEYEHPEHVSLASLDVLDETHRSKLRNRFSADEEYYKLLDEDLNSPRSSRTVRNRHDRSEEQQSSQHAPENKPPQTDSSKEDEPAPAPEKRDTPVKQPDAEQVPPPVPTFHSYDISVRQIAQNVFPATPVVAPGCPAAFAPTNVFAYGPANVANTPFHNWPGFTIEAQVRTFHLQLLLSFCSCRFWPRSRLKTQTLTYRH